MARTIRYAAPGRINLIGEHTDYNLGFALPIALPERTVVTYRPDDSTALTVRSDREDGDVRIAFDTAPGDVTGWAAYVAGVMWALREAGHRDPRRDDVDHERRRDGLGCVVVGGAGMRGSRRADDRHRSSARPRRAGPHRAAGRERLCRSAHGTDGSAGLAVRRTTPGVDDRLPGADRAAGGIRSRRLGCRLAAHQFPRTTPACGRRVRVAAGVVRTRRGRSRGAARCGRCRTVASASSTRSPTRSMPAAPDTS